MLSAKRITLIVWLAAIILLLSACKGEAMWFQAEEVCVFSAMEGTLTYNGEPAVGAKVVRIVRWKDEKGESDSVVTDEMGHFSLPVMNRTLRQLFPAEFVAHQSIFVYYQGNEFQIWGMGKSDISEGSELGGKAEIICELTDEPIPVNSNAGLLVTSCVWSGINREIE